MTAINHAVTGSIIAVYIHEPVLALPLALASHFVLDSLPHLAIKPHNSRLFKEVLTTDVILSTLLLVYIAVLQPAYWLLIIGCALLAMSPDLMWLPPYIRKLKHQPKRLPNSAMRFHKNIQKHEYLWGYFVEIPWLVVTLSFLIISLNRHWG
jgi:hypothetical protein